MKILSAFYAFYDHAVAHGIDSDTIHDRFMAIRMAACPSIRSMTSRLAAAASMSRASSAGWQGKLICDGYGGYKQSFANGFTEVGCMAHARRKPATRAAQQKPGRTLGTPVTLSILWQQSA